MSFYNFMTNFNNKDTLFKLLHHLFIVIVALIHY